jgi:5-formyltetrahydrofolate cyclo-ligase
VNPDSPQSPVRRLALQLGKVVLMPSPRLKHRFVVLDPRRLSSSVLRIASSIRGAFKHGRLIGLDQLPNVDLMVVGSVAVSTEGNRLGKGGGYSEIEYAILRELGLVDDTTPIATTIHELQILDLVPRENHDVSVDIIVTPRRVMRNDTLHRPAGIIWNKVTPDMFVKIPVLKELERNSQATRLK